MITKIIAKAVLLDDQNRVLLLRRSATDTRRPSEQDFPGGGVEPDEDPLTAVGREIMEEAGLEVPLADLQLIYTATQAYSDISSIRLLYIARLHQPAEITLSFEHDAYQWLPIDRALEAFPHPVYGTGLAYAVEHGLLP